MFPATPVCQGSNCDPGRRHAAVISDHSLVVVATQAETNTLGGITVPSNSTSWGECEPIQGQAETKTLGAIFAQAAAQGQSFFAASGDTGAHDCTPPGGPLALGIAVDSPASDPNVTGVGGTKLLLNPDNSYNNEQAWPPEPQSFYGSGGGKSTYWLRPSWQTGPGLDVSANAPRQVPDISLDADPVTGYSIYTCVDTSNPCTASGAHLRSLGGTSAGAPGWAAFTAIYNQYAACAGKPNLGFANPTLYSLGSIAQTFTSFNDVTVGDNNEGTALGYGAGPNCDMVTGLGTLRASDLAQDAAGPPSSGLKVGSLDKTVGVTGDTVHVFGCGFATSGGQVPSVIFGSHPSPNVTYLGSTDLSVVAPFNLNGTVSVTVTNPGGLPPFSTLSPTTNRRPAASCRRHQPLRHPPQ
jgi:subtilase family serine protease